MVNEELFRSIGAQLGVAGGGAAVALYLAHMLIRFQRDFTSRYAQELAKVRTERDDSEARANYYASILAQHGLYPNKDRFPVADAPEQSPPQPPPRAPRSVRAKINKSPQPGE